MWLYPLSSVSFTIYINYLFGNTDKIMLNHCSDCSFSLITLCIVLHTLHFIFIVMAVTWPHFCRLSGSIGLQTGRDDVTSQKAVWSFIPYFSILRDREWVVVPFGKAIQCNFLRNLIKLLVCNGDRGCKQKAEKGFWLLYSTICIKTNNTWYLKQKLRNITLQNLQTRREVTWQIEDRYSNAVHRSFKLHKWKLCDVKQCYSESSGCDMFTCKKGQLHCVLHFFLYETYLFLTLFYFSILTKRTYWQLLVSKLPWRNHAYTTFQTHSCISMFPKLYSTN